MAEKGVTLYESTMQLMSDRIIHTDDTVAKANAFLGKKRDAEKVSKIIK